MVKYESEMDGLNYGFLRIEQKKVEDTDSSIGGDGLLTGFADTAPGYTDSKDSGIECG